MAFGVRRAVIGDEGVLRSLRLQALSDAPLSFSSTYERELARTPEDWRKWMWPGVTFLVETGGQAQGLVAGVRDPREERVVHLMAMWVHPELRGTGAADLLVTSVKEWAKEVGAWEVRLDVVEMNGHVRRCHERAGFRRRGRTGVVAKSGDVEIEMRWETDGRKVMKSGASGERS